MVGGWLVCSNFGRSDLGSTEADFCNSRFFLQFCLRSTRFAHFCSPSSASLREAVGAVAKGKLLPDKASCACRISCSAVYGSIFKGRCYQYVALATSLHACTLDSFRECVFATPDEVRFSCSLLFLFTFHFFRRHLALLPRKRGLVRCLTNNPPPPVPFESCF